MVQRLLVDLAHDVRLLQDGLDLAGEDELPTGEGVVQRLHADAVAGQKQLALALVPDGQGKHAAQPGKHRRAFLAVQVDNHLCIGVAAKSDAFRLQHRAMVGIVVHLAVVGDPQRAVGRRHGLVAGGRQVDDGQTAVGQPGATIG